MGVLFRGFFVISGILAQIFIRFTKLDPKIHQNLPNYRNQFFGQNGTSPSENRSRYPPPEKPAIGVRVSRDDVRLRLFKFTFFTNCFAQVLQLNVPKAIAAYSTLIIALLGNQMEKCFFTSNLTLKRILS